MKWLAVPPHSQTVFSGRLMTVSLRVCNSSAGALWSAPLGTVWAEIG